VRRRSLIVCQSVARGAATLPRQEKNNSEDLKRNGVNITGFELELGPITEANTAGISVRACVARE
jgi:hypothetical protein